MTREHLEILRHTLYRAARRVYFGDSPEMQDLVRDGYMIACGKAAWCDDERFAITLKGVDYVKAQEVTP